MNNDKTGQTSIHETLLMHSRADRALRLAVARSLEQFNLTMMEWLLIGVVAEYEVKGVTMTDVAVRLDVTLPQITALTIRLTKAKLLKQKLSRQDRRSRKLYCTPVAARLITQIEDVVRQTVADLASDVSKADFDSFVRVIRTLSDRKPVSTAQKT